MANTVRIEVKKEVPMFIHENQITYGDNNTTDQSTLSEFAMQVYIACDGIECWIGTANTFNEVKELVNPEELLELLSETLSQDEIEIIEAALFSSGYKYKFGNEYYTAKK